MLRTTDISLRIGPKQILDTVSAEFHPGEFNMILGPNGSGKSSFLKIFAGEWTSYSGHVSYDDIDIHKLKKEELARQRAVMSQQPDLSFPLTVEEVVMMGRYPHFAFNPGKKDRQICEEVIQAMNLGNFRERNYLTLSGGEKQRVQYARVLAQIWDPQTEQPKYLILDEPLTSLDISYQHEFLEIAREFLKQNTVLIAIIHDLNLAIQYADKLFFLKNGKMVAQGPTLRVLNEELIRDVFGVETTIVKNPVTGLPLVIYSRQNPSP